MNDCPTPCTNTAPCLSPILMGVDLLSASDLYLFGGTIKCEDCPEINQNPPSESECPHFDGVTYEFPICTQDGSASELIARALS